MGNKRLFLEKPPHSGKKRQFNFTTAALNLTTAGTVNFSLGTFWWPWGCNRIDLSEVLSSSLSTAQKYATVTLNNSPCFLTLPKLYPTGLAVFRYPEPVQIQKGTNTRKSLATSGEQSKSNRFDWVTAIGIRGPETINIWWNRSSAPGLKARSW